MCLVNSAGGHKNVNICLAELQAWPVASWQGQRRRNILQFVRQQFCHNSFIYSTAQIKQMIESLSSSQIFSQQQHK